jgi:hypothetical protein
VIQNMVERNYNIEANITIKVLDMRDGAIKKFIFDNRVFIENNNVSKEYNHVNVSHRKYKIYPNVVTRWIDKNHITEFSLDKFFEDNPKFKSHIRRTDEYLSRLIQDKILVQVGNNRFKVNR